MATFRGFIAIDIDATPSILELEDNINKAGADVKLVEPKNIHITLKFLGDTDESIVPDVENIIKDSVSEIKPFTINLIGTGVFPNQKYIRVVWIGIKNSEIIADIANMIDEKLSKLGYKKDSRGFSAHLTIGRVKTARNKENLLSVVKKYSDVKFSSQEITSIKIKKSELTPKGPIYTTIKEVNF